MKKLIAGFITFFLVTSLTYAQWTEQTSGVTSGLNSVSPVDNNIVWVCGQAGKVLLTTNGGTNWVVKPSPNVSLNLYNIWGIDGNKAIVTGTSTIAYVYKTSNAGVNWFVVFTQSGGFVDAVGGVGNNYLLYGDPVGGRWTLWHSQDEGSTWDSNGTYLAQSGSEAGYTNAMGGVLLSNGIDGYTWFGTDNSRIYRGRDGHSWVAQPTPGISDIFTILFSDSLSGIAGGSTGLAFTSNGGNNWVISTSTPGNGGIIGIAVKLPEIWYARGTTIYYSSTGGVNWDTATTPLGGGNFTNMVMARTGGGYNIWGVRDNGGISKYTHPIGIRRINAEVPVKFTLYQNYPNPFNPSTTIKFDISVTSYSVLTIYDALGKEVADLVRENLKPGTYEVIWNASNVSSGIYYYKLIAGKITDTRKLVLVK
jgi:hypothetical protein